MHNFINLLSSRLSGMLATAMLLTTHTGAAIAQAPPAGNARWVNPMTGTGLSTAPTLWGNYGGTYPGAVAPWGMVQVTPETSMRPSERGYYYSDSSLLKLTCLGHNSGYPNGSSGMLAITFMRGMHSSLPPSYAGRPFGHSGEQAEPGYYKVTLDDGDVIETTAAPHSGIISYTSRCDTTTIAIYQAGRVTVTSPHEVRCDAGHAILKFSSRMTGHAMRGDTLLATFVAGPALTVSMSASSTSHAQSLANGGAELCGGDFAAVRRNTLARWNQELACVDMNGASDSLRRMFYTALYHSMLMPCNIADVGQKPRFAGYSSWDTFRTLHPLLTLLKPGMQAAIVDDMLDVYRQHGTLPKGPMTGFHAIPVLLDSYVKGVAHHSAAGLMEACRWSYTTAMSGEAMYQYSTLGYVDARQEQSVSVTAELSYDDWAMARLCSLAGNDSLAATYQKRSRNYANLWDAQTLFMLPRHGQQRLRHSGELGYQESNKWTASLFAPHDVRHLVHLSGGDSNFAGRLEHAFAAGHVVFDNETVVHYPWLYVWARRPGLAWQRVNAIATTCYADAPGGIPGNDDLGSMSSWLAFAVMGLMPVCPGTDEYVLLPPMAEEIVLHLEGGATMRLCGTGRPHTAAMPQPLLNGRPLQRCHVTHGELLHGGSISFDKGRVLDTATMQLPYSLCDDEPRFTLRLSRQTVHTTPDAGCAMPVSVANAGGDGVCTAILTCDGDTVASKNIFVASGTVVSDTLNFRLYAEGRHLLRLGRHKVRATVARGTNGGGRLRCTAFDVKPVVRIGEKVAARVRIKNVGGRLLSDTIAVSGGQRRLASLAVSLHPGEEKTYTVALPASDTAGMSVVSLCDTTVRLKVYADATDATVLDADFSSGAVTDKSGFGNDGTCHGALAFDTATLTTGSEAYVEFPPTASLMYPYQRLTMLTWIRPVGEPSRGYVDFFTKGDYHVLKTQGGNRLGFFAGGWGRGECEVVAGSGWQDGWHLVAGVCTGDSIKLYVDGRLMQAMAVKGTIAASEMQWNLGRNAEMPFSRFGRNTFFGTRIYAEALTDGQVAAIYAAERGSLPARP